MYRRSRIVAALMLTLLWVAKPAFAQLGQAQGGETGVAQVGLGSAWVATADDPMAVYYNPAAMARQRTSIHFGADFMSLDRCFTRVNEDGSPVSPGNGLPAAGTAGGPAATMCTTKTPRLNPGGGFVWRINDRWAFGVALLGPHGVPTLDWPETVSYPGGVEPAPTRFMMIHESAVLGYNVFSLGYNVNDKLSVGGGFTWGSLTGDISIFGEGVSPAVPAGVTPTDSFITHQEVKLTVNLKDRYMPGIVASALWMPTSSLDGALWYRKSNRLEMKTSIRMQSRYWLPNGSPNTTPCAANEPVDCNITDPPGDEGHSEFLVGQEVHGGLRFHRPRDGASNENFGVRDPIANDRYSVEGDVAWAGNGIVPDFHIYLDAGAGLKINGLTNAFLPDETYIPKNWKDSWAFRLGSQYVLKPNRLALNVGTFFETAAQTATDIHLHFDVADRGGIGGGVVLRAGRSDVILSYQRILWKALDNNGKGGIQALSGDVSAGNLSRQIVDGGKLTSKQDDFAVSYRVRF
jgi:long-subunit fatty acid transport protein